MGAITLDLLRKRAEHNEGMVSTLEELALHQSNIEKIERLGQLCPRLKILYLQSNLIGKIQNLHKLKDLQYLNLAINNVTKLENLQKCESLEKLDLTMNFVPKAGLMTVASLEANEHLKDLYLMGNPCADWPGYRQFVIASLPQLQRLDGAAIKPSDRIAAKQALPHLTQQLREELAAEGIDPDNAALVEDDSMFDEHGDVIETGHADPDTGEMKRPWCPATRILEHRETERQEREAAEKKAAAQKGDALDGGGGGGKPARRDGFPPLPADGERVWQKNEGEWEFSLDEDDAGRAVVLEVDVGKYLDTSLIKVDCHPTFIRLLIKGRLLQLSLPVEVRSDAASAQRSGATGKLVISMPKENPDATACDPTSIRPRADRSNAAVGKTAAGGGGGGALRQVAVVTTAADGDDEDFVPDL